MRPAALATPPVSRSTFPSCGVELPFRRGHGEDGREYSRTDGTPGWEALETAVGQVEGGDAVAFSSGMAAIAAVLDLLPGGGRVVAPADSYFGFGELLADGQQRTLAVDRVDLTDTGAVRAAADGAALLWLETPCNPLLEVVDLPALCATGRRAGALVGVDNTFATPLLQQPLALGADFVVHSATKFIGGHSDLLSGITIARDQAPPDAPPPQSPSGATPGALEAFLALRGRAPSPCGSTAASATPASWPASTHPAVSRVRYPDFPATRTPDGSPRRCAASALVSFELATPTPPTPLRHLRVIASPPASAGSSPPSSGAASSPGKNTYLPGSCG